ncbi:MAG: acyltransferase family protein [Gammaproteobacteria bacterium]|nr:acyltransferase family protein [Gammaproteobacteria bacterium]
MTDKNENAAIATSELSTTDQGRRYDIDALRVLAFSLLILYHVAMFYVLDWGFHIKSAYQSEAIQVPMLLVNQWRMSLLFVISGLAVSFVWHKYSAGQFAIRRVRSLLLPLLFGMAVIVAPQCYYEALGKGIIEPGFPTFMIQYWTFQDFPGEAWAGEEQIHWTWNHLWYLPYLLIYTLLLIPLARFLDGPGRRLRDWFRALRGVWIILLPTVPLMLYGYFIFPSFPRITHALLDDWYAHSMYFTFFVIGYLVGRDTGFWAELARLRKATLALAVCFFGLFMFRNAMMPDDAGFLLGQLSSAITYLNRWLWILAILGWGHYLLNRPMKWLPYATEAVYPWYILHQTLIIILGYELGKLSLGPVAEPVLVLGGTIAGCLLIHEFVIRRNTLLRPLFGLK